MTRHDEKASNDANALGEEDGVGSSDSDIRALYSFTIQRLASISTRIAQASIYEPHGLGIADWRVLAVLDYLDRPTVLTVSAHAAILRTQLSKVLAGLEARGLVRREVNPQDGRSFRLDLTDEGRALVAALLDASRARNEAMLADLDAGERAQLMRLTRKVLATSRAHLARLERGEPPSDTD